MTDNRTPADLPDLADVLAAIWRTCMGSQPPAGWLTHATTAIDTHLGVARR